MRGAPQRAAAGPVNPLPAPVQQGVEGALGRLGHPSRIVSVLPVAGGCINHGARVTVEGGADFFLKWNSSAPPRFFDAEADGLRALGTTGALRVPGAVARGGGSRSPAWLLLEYIPSGKPTADFEERLGWGLARLHASAPPGAAFGWSRSNWIGSLPQANRATRSWSAFWLDQRLAPQLYRARDRGFLRAPRADVLDRVLDRVPAALRDVDAGPIHLLHGDLWSGNSFSGPTGEPVIIDPAVYLGHGEVDLAMTELFGGFGPRFYRSYAEAGAVTDAYPAYRRDLYQLYYLLVHVNLFGSQYEERTLSAADRVAAALAG
ncbi:MAG: fructosamine kinase family protein [Gemmatimonadetes bacterium]|nr:fructosamine kinase family protein [Gemmatimonadota bacterium]